MVLRCQEIEGDMKNQGEKKTKKQKKTKCQDTKSTHLLGGCLFGACFTVKLGIFLRCLTQAYPPGGVRAIYIYRERERERERERLRKRDIERVRTILTMTDRDWFAKRSGQNARHKCQAKARSHTCRPIQINSDSDKKSDNFKESRKSQKIRNIQTHSKDRPKFRQIQKNSHKFRKVQINSDRFRP